MINDIISESIKEKKQKLAKFKRNMLYFRWTLLIFIIPAFLFGSEYVISKNSVYQIMVLTAIYNTLITLLIIFSRPERVKKEVAIVFYVDVVLICCISYILGGIQSDIFIVLLFIIAYYGISRDIASIVNITIFTITVYSVFTLGFERNRLNEFNYWRLITRDLFMLITAYAVSIVITEVKKYDEMHKREFKLARTDKLTGLANRHYFDQKLEEEALYADYARQPLNVLMFDIDNFKKFNDTYGHIWGDKLLSMFGDIVMQNIRKTDIPVRYGGEEFIVLIGDLDLEMVKSIGDRIRGQLEKQNLNMGSEHTKCKVTVSCGIAQYPTHSKDIKEVIDFADKALYYAKEIGKNIVVSYDEIGKLRETVQIDIETYLNN
ncbi:GGDEF domain-containing protein [Acetivibrio cellulolyticus]|uniref:GGDEF domain-containing protein n=1 Tax=Acetivibrio cellulolyticus TaxID=35830 RepID=UPI0001E2D516|nr:GGDEF domain-containing protein [Acetivibrio cellulolyticus]